MIVPRRVAKNPGSLTHIALVLVGLLDPMRSQRQILLSLAAVVPLEESMGGSDLKHEFCTPNGGE